MDPHADMFSPPPPAYSATDFDRKIAQATQLSEETAKWERPTLDVDEDGWPVYDPSLFEEKRPVPISKKGEYIPERPVAETPTMKMSTMSSPGASSSKYLSLAERSGSPSLPKIVPLRIAKKTKAHEAMEDSLHRHSRAGSSSSSTSVARYQSTVEPQDGAGNCPTPIAPPIQPLAPSVIAYDHRLDVQQVSESIPPEPNVPVFHQTASYVADNHHIAQPPPQMSSEIESPLVPTYSLEASQHDQQLPQPHEYEPSPSPSYSQTEHNVEALASTFNQSVAVSPLPISSPSPAPSISQSLQQPANSSAYQIPSYASQNQPATVHEAQIRTPVPRTLPLQHNNFQTNEQPAGSFPHPELEHRSWTPSLEPLELPPLNGYTQNQHRNSFTNSSYLPPTQHAMTPHHPRHRALPQPVHSASNMGTPQLPYSNRPPISMNYIQPATPRLSFNPHTAYSPGPPASQFLPQARNEPINYDIGSLYNSAVSSQMKSTVPATYSRPVTMANPASPNQHARQSLAWQSPSRPVSVFNTMSNSPNVSRYNNHYPQHSTNVMQPLPENNWYTR